MAVKGVLLGLSVIAFSLWLWFGINGNPVNELKLIRRGQPTSARTYNCNVEAIEDEHGHGGYEETCEFDFAVNGQTFTGWTDDGTQGEPLGVVYLPEDPSVFRTQASMSTSVFDWLFFRVIVGSAILLTMIAFGVSIMRKPEPSRIR